MQIGMIGLGRLGANMVERLRRAGHDVVAYDVSPDAAQRIAAGGATGTASLEDLVARLSALRIIWPMVPADNPGDATIAALRREFGGHAVKQE